MRMPRLALTLPAVLAAIAFAATATWAATEAGAAAKPAARAARTPVAHAASTYMTGLGDESPEMFSDSDAQQLKTKIARYIAPYDAVAHSYSLDKAKAWIKYAEGQHMQILVAFYHSEYSPLRL